MVQKNLRHKQTQDGCGIEPTLTTLAEEEVTPVVIQG